MLNITSEFDKEDLWRAPETLHSLMPFSPLFLASGWGGLCMQQMLGNVTVQHQNHPPTSYSSQSSVASEAQPFDIVAPATSTFGSSISSSRSSNNNKNNNTTHQHQLWNSMKWIHWLTQLPLFWLISACIIHILPGHQHTIRCLVTMHLQCLVRWLLQIIIPCPNNYGYSNIIWRFNNKSVLHLSLDLLWIKENK